MLTLFGIVNCRGSAAIISYNSFCRIMLAASLEKVTAAYQAIYLRGFIANLDN